MSNATIFDEIGRVAHGLALTRNNAQNDRAFREVSYGMLRQAERLSVSYGCFQTPSFLLAHLEALVSESDH